MLHIIPNQGLSFTTYKKLQLLTGKIRFMNLVYFWGFCDRIQLYTIEHAVENIVLISVSLLSLISIIKYLFVGSLEMQFFSVFLSNKHCHKRRSVIFFKLLLSRTFSQGKLLLSRTFFKGKLLLSRTFSQGKLLLSSTFSFLSIWVRYI